MDRLEAMRVFVRVVETGSFSAVAREANIGQPAVSKQVAALEEHLHARLLHRTSRNLNLTEAGQIYYEAAVRLLSDLENTEQAVGRGQTQPSGLLRVALSAGLVGSSSSHCSRHLTRDILKLPLILSCRIATWI